MSKAISKITVCCPHCKAHQQEPALAKSTFCRRCSEYFAITASAVADSSPIEAPSKQAQPSSTWARAAAPVPATFTRPPGSPTPPGSERVAPPPAAPAAEAASAGLLGKIEGIFASKPKTQVAHCFECNGWHEVGGTAQSTTCKSCGAYIDLQDYKVTGSFSRNIKTRGSVYLSSKGDLSSSKIVCSQATIHGKMRGNLVCPGKVTIRVQGKLFGSVEAGELIVEKGSEVFFARPVQAATAEVHGRMSGQIIAGGHVTIFKSGLLDGAVSATGFSVEKGGCFQGELTISPRQSPPTEAAEAEAQKKVLPAEPEHPGFLVGGEQSPALG